MAEPLTPQREAEIRAAAVGAVRFAPRAWMTYAQDLLAELDRVRAELEQVRGQRDRMLSELPSRFQSTPLQVEEFLSRHLAEDVHLRYQQAVGGRAVSEAAKDVRMESHTPLASETYRNGMVFAADHIDPLKGGGHYPSQLIRFGKTAGDR